MITFYEYDQALAICKQYEAEQRILHNERRITIGQFIGMIPRISGKYSTQRLINGLLFLVNHEEYTLKERHEYKAITYLDEITWDNFRLFRNMGRKTYDMFLIYKEKITIKHDNTFDV
jgi:hypothetical protein